MEEKEDIFFLEDSLEDVFKYDSKEATKGVKNSLDNEESAKILCETYLKNNNIYYKKEVMLNNDRTFQFIIPGAVVITRNGMCDKRNSRKVGRAFDQINKIIKLIPDDFVINVFLEYLVEKELIEYWTISDRVKIIFDLKNLYFKELPILTKHTGILRTLGSFANNNHEILLEKYKNKVIHVSEKVYNRTIAIMTDEEIKRMHEFSLQVIKEDLKEGIELTTSNSTSFMFHIFIDRYTFPFASVKNNRPIREIEGTTKKCSKCPRIQFIDFIEDGACKGVCKPIN